MDKAGFSLVEILCVLVISVISLTVIAQMFVNYKRTAALESALSEVQENGRYALYIMRESLRGAQGDVYVYNEPKFRVKKDYYFVKATARKNKQGQSIYALYQREGNNRNAELVPGVLDLKVTCLVANDAGSIYEQQPNAVTHWDRVRALILHVLLVSQNAVLPHPKSYYFNGVYHIPPDKRLYKSMQLMVPVTEPIGRVTHS